MNVSKDFELMNQICKYESQKIKVGDFIRIPSWKTFGYVTKVLPAKDRGDNVQCVLFQEDPESEATIKCYLELGDYTIED